MKCVVVEIEGVNQYPSHLTSSLGGEIEPYRCIGERDTGPLSLFVLQWMSSVFGIEKPTPSREGSEGSFSFFFFFFFSLFFFYHIFVVKVQEIAWSASYGQNKTVKQSNDPLHLIMGQTNTPRP